MINKYTTPSKIQTMNEYMHQEYDSHVFGHDQERELNIQEEKTYILQHFDF